MLSDPRRLRTANGFGYLVSWKHRVRTQSEPAAVSIVERLLADPANVASLRAGIGRPEATMDELVQWLVTGLASGAPNLLKTRVTPPVLDRPPETNLFDLLPPQEPKGELESLTFEFFDDRDVGFAAHYQVHAPTGDPSGFLPAGERKLVGELEPKADVEVELSSIVLSLLPETETADEQDAKVDDDAPIPVGPGGVEPSAPRAVAPQGPDTLSQTTVSLTCDEGTVDSVKANVPLGVEQLPTVEDRLEFSRLLVSVR